MKKMLLSMVMIGMTVLGMTTYANDVCDQVFYWKLRQWNSYTFHDTFNGTPDSSYYLWNYKVNSVEQQDYNKSPDFPKFKWTAAITGQNYEVKPGQSIKFLEARTQYPVIDVPQKRDPKNLLVKYTVTYSKSPEKTAPRTSHVECKYYEITRCGDGIVDTDRGEICDPKDPNKTGWGNGGCDASCKPINTVVEQPKCNSDYNGKTIYNEKHPVAALNSDMALCSKGKVTSFVGPDQNGNYSWTCNNASSNVSCSAKEMRCGDGTKNGSEQCDPKDPNKTGWGNGGCDASCKPINTIIPKADCDATFYGKLRHGRGYVFDDQITGTPTKSRYLKDFKVDHREQLDFNGADPFPSFEWTQEIKNQNMILNPNQTIKILTATSPYYVREKPIKRDKNNLYLEYTIWYSDSQNGAWSAEKECKYYEITRCGDGILDPEYGETCDPNDSSKTGWWNGGCDENCKPKDIPQIPGQCNSQYNGQTVENLTGGNHLCTTGTMTQFQFNSATNRWTWKCDGMNWTTPVECSAVRKTLTQGACNSQYNGQTVENLTGGNHLCTTGTYGNFNYDQATQKWTWTCNGEAGSTPVQCSAVKPSRPNIEKDLIGDKNHKYKVGELVGFRMPFGNTGSQTINNVKIRDILPLNLEYVSSAIQGVPSYTNGVYLSGGVQVLEYSGFSLSSGQQGVLLMTGRVLNTNPDNRTNRVGIYENNYLWDYDTEPYQPAPRALHIEKTVDKPQVFSGEIVEFTIKVSNTEGTFTWLKVVDTLPKGLVFVPNTQFLTGQTTTTELVSFATGVNGTGEATLNWELKFPQGFKKSDSFLLKLKARLVESSRTKYTNMACVFNPDDPKDPKCDPEDVTPKLEDVKLKIKKYVSTSVGGSREDNQLNMDNGPAYFKLVISNATAPLTGFRVTDRIEGNLTFDTGSWVLADNAFTGVITFGPNNPSKPVYKITPTVSGTQPADIVWKVDMGTGYFMSGDSLTIIIKTQKKGDQNNIGHVYYPKPNGGEGHDEDPARVYKTTSGWGGWGWGGSRGWGGWGWGGRYAPSCGNGRKDGNEVCDLGGHGTIGSDGRLFRNTDEYDTRYAGYTCTNTCRLESQGQKIAPQCFNINNGSISIMKGEALPFYWNMQAQLGLKTISEKQNWLKTNFAYSCSDRDANSKIELSSMQCKFAVYAPGKGNGRKVYEFTTDCVDINGWDTALGNQYWAVEDRVNQNMQGWFGGSELVNKGLVKNVFDSLNNQEDYPILLPLSSKLLIKEFGKTTSITDKKNTTLTWMPNGGLLGEYKLALEDVGYKRCTTDKDGKGTAGNLRWEGEIICEVDFAVTEPYLIQKSPYGIGNKATTDLTKYQLKNGTNFMGEFFKTTEISNKAYETPKNMKNLFTQFKNKYQKLAKSLGNNGLSKVPGKSIYFYDGTEELTSLLGTKITNKPFTLIASKGQNLTIKGNLPTNAMIMTEGTITFDAGGSCNGDRKTYGHAGQMVQGIFYAGQGFKSSNDQDLKNTFGNLRKGERCNYGNLHIKGVAIGDLSDVVEKRRSELYTWFSADSSKGSEKKKDIIVNGASVLVEYNPSLRGALPPGAEEFNKALEVYRK